MDSLQAHFRKPVRNTIKIHLGSSRQAKRHLSSGRQLEAGSAWRAFKATLSLLSLRQFERRPRRVLGGLLLQRPSTGRSSWFLRFGPIWHQNLESQACGKLPHSPGRAQTRTISAQTVRTVHSPKKLVSAEGLSQLPAPAPSVEAALCCVGFEKDWRRRSERRHLQAVAAQPGNTRTVLQKPGPYTMPYRPYQQRPNITIS